MSTFRWFNKRKEANNVSDRMLLKAIYDQYYDEFCAYDRDSSIRATKIYVPVDLFEISKKLDLNSDIVFGRLYYHLARKYRFTEADGTTVSLFDLRVAGEKHAVNFPFLSAVVADLEQSFARFTLPIILSALALIISTLSFLKH